LEGQAKTLKETYAIAKASYETGKQNGGTIAEAVFIF
jgi:hypothetical protein